MPEFETAYRLSGDAALLYNIAQSYRLADHPDEAIHYYNTFLRRDPNTAKRAEVERRLKERHSTKAPPNQVTEPTGKAPSGEPAAQSNGAAAPQVVGESPRQWRGLFASAELGVGYVSASSADADVQLSNVGVLLSVRVGAFVVPRLALFGQVSSAGATDPSISGGGNSGTASGTLAFTGVGAGALYYTPTRWFGTASLLFQKLS